MTSEPDEPARGEVLVAILNNKADFSIAQEKLWYRVPVASAPKRWPPKWLAFYQTKIFGPEAYAVNYYGRVAGIERVTRAELFPNEIQSARTEREYFKLRLESLERLPQAIPSRKFRRVVFIPTTKYKLDQASEINDLFDDSPLEDKLWDALKRENIPAERQWGESVGKKFYQLDFAIFCAKGNIDVEADGDTWHIQRRRAALDNDRNNALTSNGWHVLRFNGRQIRDLMVQRCMSRITKTIKRLGGLIEGLVPRTFYTAGDQTIQQLSLFERGPEYDDDVDISDDEPDEADPKGL